MVPRTIAELPFAERPILELLHLDSDRGLPSRDYAGFGWARAPGLWLETDTATDARQVRDALVLALHSADDSTVIADDVELDFECPDGSVAVLASAFLAHWLPRLPSASTIVLALCNPHRAVLRALPALSVPLHYGLGEVASWSERTGDGRTRIILTAERWLQTPPM